MHCNEFGCFVLGPLCLDMAVFSPSVGDLVAWAEEVLQEPRAEVFDLAADDDIDEADVSTNSLAVKAIDNQPKGSDDRDEAGVSTNSLGVGAIDNQPKGSEEPEVVPELGLAEQKAACGDTDGLLFPFVKPAAAGIDGSLGTFAKQATADQFVVVHRGYLGQSLDPCSDWSRIGQEVMQMRFEDLRSYHVQSFGMLLQRLEASVGYVAVLKETLAAIEVLVQVEQEQNARLGQLHSAKLAQLSIPADGLERPRKLDQG